jgi:hypothetical protein
LLESAPQPGDLISVALLEPLEALCPAGDPVVNANLMTDAPGGGHRQQVPLVFSP